MEGGGEEDRVTLVLLGWLLRGLSVKNQEVRVSVQHKHATREPARDVNRRGDEP